MNHEPECRSNCPCCAVDWDCTCGATYTAIATAIAAIKGESP